MALSRIEAIVVDQVPHYSIDKSLFNADEFQKEVVSHLCSDNEAMSQDESEYFTTDEVAELQEAVLAYYYGNL